jgi:hypothetical protein
MLKPIAQDLWCIEGEIYMPGKVHFPTRTTVARLRDGSLWLHSPIPIDEATAQQLEALGPVRHLVSPCLFHHLSLGHAKARFPQARIYAPPGLAQKRPDLVIDEELGHRVPAAWEADLDVVWLQGAPKVNEFEFFHRPSRTLVVTDLLFHNTAPKNARTAFVLWLVGALRRLAPSRSWRLFAQDKALLAASLQRVLAWPIERLIVGHGDIVEERAHERTREALGWLLAAAPKAVAGA